ncbi:hypothetical protein FPANT_5655 [Fusarium pseudoanthophilum]|uniref:Uncharacterized protein n=1 Tax=Fusarium pseudoanthophilum TaxID=48495 RepID=A0A8H5P7L3_9HYPO|nr:hypothetical protein FPANT_5655 [Fusarium pseudoanthophilum]
MSIGLTVPDSYCASQFAVFPVWDVPVQVVELSLAGVWTGLGVAAGSVLLVEPVAEPARLPALVQVAVMAEEPSPEVAADSARAAVAVVAAGIVAVAYAAANTVGGETVVAASGAVNILDFGVSKKVFAAVKGRGQTAFSVERVVEATRRAADTYAAVAVDDDAVADIAAGTACSAPPEIAAAAKHSQEVYIARQLVASGVPHTLVRLYRIPGKSFACPRTAPSAAAEGTFVVVVAAGLAVEASNRTAAVEGSYIAGNYQVYKMKADSCRALAAVAVSLVGSGPGPGHGKACSSWPLLNHCIPLSRYRFQHSICRFVAVRRPTRLRFMVRLGPWARVRRDPIVVSQSNVIGRDGLEIAELQVKLTTIRWNQQNFL